MCRDSAFLPRTHLLWPRPTLFFSTRPSVWYRTGPAKCTTTKLGSRLSLLGPRQGLPARALSMRVWSWAALLGRLRRHSCRVGAGGHHRGLNTSSPSSVPGPHCSRVVTQALYQLQHVCACVCVSTLICRCGRETDKRAHKTVTKAPKSAAWLTG